MAGYLTSKEGVFRPPHFVDAHGRVRKCRKHPLNYRCVVEEDAASLLRVFPIAKRRFEVACAWKRWGCGLTLREFLELRDFMREWWLEE